MTPKEKIWFAVYLVLLVPAGMAILLLMDEIVRRSQSDIFQEVANKMVEMDKRK